MQNPHAGAVIRKPDIATRAQEAYQVVYTDLIQAALSGDVAATKAVLTTAGDLANSRKGYALKCAAVNGHPEVLQCLLDAGADIHTEHDAALVGAASNGHLACVQLLLGAGADVHARQDEALRATASKGHAEVMRCLLSAGADVHAETDGALFTAAFNGHTECVQLLLDHGANVHAQGDQALLSAANNGHTTVVEQLLAAGADVQAADNQAIALAILHQHFETAKVLLDAGAHFHISAANLVMHPPETQTFLLRHSPSIPDLDPVDLARKGLCCDALLALLSRCGHDDVATVLSATQMLPPFSPKDRADLLFELLGPRPDNPVFASSATPHQENI